MYVTDVYYENYRLSLSGFGIGILSKKVVEYFSKRCYTENELYTMSACPMNESQVKVFLDQKLSPNCDTAILINWVHDYQTKKGKS